LRGRMISESGGITACWRCNAQWGEAHVLHSRTPISSASLFGAALFGVALVVLRLLLPRHRPGGVSRRQPACAGRRCSACWPGRSSMLSATVDSKAHILNVLGLRKNPIAPEITGVPDLVWFGAVGIYRRRAVSSGSSGVPSGVSEVGDKKRRSQRSRKKKSTQSGKTRENIGEE